MSGCLQQGNYIIPQKKMETSLHALLVKTDPAKDLPLKTIAALDEVSTVKVKITDTIRFIFAVELTCHRISSI